MRATSTAARSRRRTTTGTRTIAPYGLFRTADSHVNICVGNDSQFLRFCEALDCARLARDAKFATNPDRLAHRAELLAEIDRVLSVRTAQSVLDALDRVGVPAGRVAGVADVLDSPETRARGMVLEFERPDCGTARVLNTPCTFDGVAPAVRQPPPRLGEHNADVDDLRSLYQRRVPT